MVKNESKEIIVKSSVFISVKNINMFLVDTHPSWVILRPISFKRNSKVSTRLVNMESGLKMSALNNRPEIVQKTKLSLN